MTPSPDPASPTSGTMQLENDRATLTFRRRLDHPPQVVWESITDPHQLGRWYLTDSKLSPGPGGSIEMLWGPNKILVTGAIVVWDPPRVFEHEWNVAPGKYVPRGERSIVRWELTAEGRGTVLVMTHRKFAPFPKVAATYFVAAVDGLLDRLQAHLDGGPLPDWRRRMDELRAN